MYQNNSKVINFHGFIIQVTLFRPLPSSHHISVLLYLAISVSYAKHIEINKYYENIVEYLLCEVFSQKNNPKFDIQITNKTDFRMKTMLGSSLPPVVCRRPRILFTFFVFDCV